MNNFTNRALNAFTGGISNGEFGVEEEDIIEDYSSDETDEPYDYDY